MARQHSEFLEALARLRDARRLIRLDADGYSAGNAPRVVVKEEHARWVGRETKSLEQARADIEKRLIQVEAQSLQEKWLASLRSKAYIKTF